jgi:hypothetical protein
MRDPPDAAALLALATDNDGALAARARAIAAREAAAGEGAYAAVRRALSELYGAAPDAVLLAKLAADLRAGRFDGDLQIARLLWDFAVQRLRESNPDFLAEI